MVEHEGGFGGFWVVVFFSPVWQDGSDSPKNCTIFTDVLLDAYLFILVFKYRSFTLLVYSDLSNLVRVFSFIAHLECLDESFTTAVKRSMTR